MKLYLFDSTLRTSTICLFQDTKFFILLRTSGEHSYLALISKVYLCWNSISGYYFHLFGIKIKLYKENRYSPKYSEISIILSFFFPSKIALKALLFKGKKSLVQQLLNWMVIFPRLKTLVLPPYFELKTFFIWQPTVMKWNEHCSTCLENEKLAIYKNTFCHLFYLLDLSAIHISSKCDLPFTPALFNCLENQWQVYNNQHEASHTVEKKTFW